MSEKIIDRSSILMYEQDQSKYSIVVNRRRAIPEVRDGLKPVQRRVIYGAYVDGLTKPSRKDKSASLVGTVMKKLHPHGDCLSGSTILSLLDGTSTTLEEAYKSNEPLNILAVDPKTMQIVPAVAHSFRIGQYTNEKYHIVLSNNSEVVCTSNHPIMIPDGNYVQAKNLTSYSRIYTRKMNLENRPRIDGQLLQNIVFNYYNHGLKDGEVKHHIDHNIYNNDPKNLEAVLKRDHTIHHINSDENYLLGLEKGRKEMFSEDGKFRSNIERKNSILASIFNKDQGIRRFKYAIGILKDRNLDINIENYESLRKELYNLPLVSKLIEKGYGNSFEDLVNLKIPTVGEIYQEKKENVKIPIEFEDEIECKERKKKQESEKTGFYSGLRSLYRLFDNMIDNKIPLSIENLYRYNNSYSNYFNPQDISYFIERYKIENPYIENIWIEKVDNAPMYDFTVNNFENMLIPIYSDKVEILGQSIGKFVPMICVHNSSIYETIVGLVNWFRTKYPIFYGKGNWGSVSGSGAAAQRYTECALSDFGYDIFIDELAQSNNIVDWISTYKRNGDREPEFLPAKIPILLINGSFGIGVGMRMNVPSHNLTEVLEATRALLRNPNQEIVLIPDLAQACTLIDADWRAISNTGRGSFRVRGNILTETDKKGNVTLRIVSLPDMITTTSIYESILKMVEDKQLPMIKDIFNALTDEKPDIIIRLKQGADPNYVKQVLYAKTKVQDTVSVNFEAVSTNGIDIKRYSYREYLLTFIDQRMNIKFRLYCNKLQQVMTRHHQVDAFIKVLESGEIETIIQMIRKQKGTDDNVIIEYIIKKCNLTDIQAKFIIGVNLSRLSYGHLKNYKEERKKLDGLIKQYTAAVTDDGTIIKKEIDQELLEIEKKYGTPRLCRVASIDEENQIPNGIFKVVITERNYIRKIPDVDKVGIVKRDNPKFILKVDNAENILIFDNKGKVFNLPVSKIPITDRSSSGTDIRILVRNLTSDIISVFYEPIFKKIATSGNKHYLTVLTRSNTIKKLDIEDFLNVSPSGLMYSKIRDEDEVVGVALVAHNLDVVISSGRNALRTKLKDIPLFKRNATGSKAMDTNDNINGLSVIYPDASDIVVVTKNGKFNRFNITMLPCYARGRKGVGVIKLDANDEVFNIFGVNESDRIRIVTSEGVEEIPVSAIKEKSRLAAGTKLMKSKGVIVRADIVR